MESWTRHTMVSGSKLWHCVWDQHHDSQDTRFRTSGREVHAPALKSSV